MDGLLRGCQPIINPVNKEDILPMLSERLQPLTWQQQIIHRDRLVGWDEVSRRLYPRAKRLIDLVLSVLFLIIAAPLMAVIALAIKLDSPGPVLYVQRRVGLNGRVFDFYKFRSMTHGHDHSQAHREFVRAYINGEQVSSLRDSNNKTIYKPASNGHQVTRVGRWLRRASLDELPQLFNVIKGDMSLVGPRPSIDYEVEMYTDYHRQRLAVLPGLTGWAQINGRSSLAFDEIVALDLEYIAQRSLRKDLSILLATFPVILQGDSAG